PEQAAGEKLDFRTDLFSVGVMLYRMLTGEQPFKGATMMAVLTALGTVTPPTVKENSPEVPQSLSDLVERLMSKNAGGRPASAAEAAKQLKAIDRELVLAARGMPTVEAAWEVVDEPAKPAADSGDIMISASRRTRTLEVAEDEPIRGPRRRR